MAIGAAGLCGRPAKAQNQKAMFKNWKFKDILLAILTAAVTWLGGSEAYTYATEESTAEYGTEVQAEEWPDGMNYKITATFYQIDQIKVGNFPDVNTTDDLGLDVVYTRTPTNEAAAAAYMEKTGIQRVSVGNRVKIEKRRGFDDVPDDVPDKD